MAPRKPLLNFDFELLPSIRRPSTPASTYNDSDTPKKRWYHYLPLCGTVLLMLAPQPSLLFVLVDFHLQTLHRPFLFGIHLTITYTLTFLAFSSLIVCVARDPGPVTETKQRSDRANDDELELTEALMPDIDFSEPGKWCRKCWAPKPERAHHCSVCGRCVLKMDHHCPWLGSNCIGHRTYPAFVHFLTSITLLAIYIAVISIDGLLYAFNNPYTVNEVTPVHMIFLAFTGVLFTLVIGSFLGYHIYLSLTNQTTLENISPFLLLKHLPPLPTSGHSLSDPPLEPELSYTQRLLVKDAQGYVEMYNLGWRKNLAQTFGVRRRTGWIYRLWCGGASPGDGRSFPRNPQSEAVLARLADELVKADKNR